MLLLSFLLACAPTCNPTEWDFYDTSKCPVCYDTAFTLAYHVQCRPDQDAHIEWEPQNTAARFEDEDRVGGVLTCTCRR